MCFASLDEDGGGSISTNELLNPLIGLGLAKSIEEVEYMVSLVDLDGSGEIEFDEFLNILVNKNLPVESRKLT